MKQKMDKLGGGIDSKPKALSIEEMEQSLAWELDGIRLQEKDFINENIPGYSPSEVQNDLDYVSGRTVGFYEEDLRLPESEMYLSRALEASLVLSISNNELVSDSEVLASAKKDDIGRGVDMLLFKKSLAEDKKAHIVGVSVDVTRTSNVKDLRNKIEKNFDNAVTNNFIQPKYVLKNTREDKQPRFPVGVFACSADNASKLIRATYEKDIETQKEFFALFVYQLRSFVSTAMRTAEELRADPDVDVKTKAVQSLLVLMEVNDYLKSHVPEGAVPLYLLADKSHVLFEQFLSEKVKHTAQVALSRIK